MTKAKQLPKVAKTLMTSAARNQKPQLAKSPQNFHSEISNFSKVTCNAKQALLSQYYETLLTRWSPVATNIKENVMTIKLFPLIVK